MDTIVEEQPRIISLKDFVYYALLHANGVTHLSKAQVFQLISYVRCVHKVDVEESEEEIYHEIVKYLILLFG